jgi:hypothetical protein
MSILQRLFSRRRKNRPRRGADHRALRLELLEDRKMLATFTVTNTDISGPGSLGQAIIDANGSANVAAPDEIHFNIPGSGVRSIQVPDLFSALPAVTDPVIIDGYTQPGASPNTLAVGSDAVLLIEINGGGFNTSGLSINSGDSTVRGLIINNFGQAGIALDSAGGNTIEGNWIGLDSSGTAAAGNSLAGVRTTDSPGNTIGGPAPGQRNVISGNGGAGELAGLLIDFGSPNQLVPGNYFGTDPSGAVGMGNSTAIAAHESSPGNMLGGPAAGAGDVISAGIEAGLRLNSDNNVVQGNLIGTDASGGAALGNGGFGVGVFSASGNLIGGTSPGTGNVIAYNAGDGVRVTDSSATGNSVLGNSIFSNDKLGVDLGGFVPGSGVSGGQGGIIIGGEFVDGPTGNDAGDTDSGPNNLQNFPVITSAEPGDTVIRGVLNSEPLSSYRIEFFLNGQADPSGFGEGQTFLGSATLETDVIGHGKSELLLTDPLPGGALVTATATDAAGNTSEFSKPYQPLVVISEDDTSDPGTLRWAIEQANVRPFEDVIRFAIPSSGVPTIRPQSPLPVITDPVVIDGATQPAGMVELDGSATEPQTGVLHVTTVMSLIRGMVINRAGSGFGIYLEGSDHNVVQGNFLGTDVTGTEALENSVGVLLLNSAFNEIGGLTEQARNIISGNDSRGVFIEGRQATNNSVRGNFIGTDVSGAAGLGNGLAGVELFDADNNTIGGITPGARNVISGNGDGISLSLGVDVSLGGGSNDNRIVGNYIGVDASGAQPVPNKHGLVITAGSMRNVVGGTDSGAGESNRNRRRRTRTPWQRARGNQRGLKHHSAGAGADRGDRQRRGEPDRIQRRRRHQSAGP